jgi:UDP-N-acetylglucosamine 1-carboxyvinyltransferase
MDMFVVEGGQRLSGRARIGGAKNAALPIMAASLASDGPLQLVDVPDLVDVSTLSRLLQTLGVAVDRSADGLLTLAVSDTGSFVADYELVRQMRASICVLGPLLARRGRACVSLPGGCNIGHRPIDLHLKGLAALGADIRVERGYVVAEADRLRGAAIDLGGPFGSTVTGTCNVMTAATLAEGRTTIDTAACEPEVVNLGHCLNRMGARIQGLGTPRLEIDGVDQLGTARHRVIPDRIEAATLLIAAAITSGTIEISPVCPDHLAAVCETLRLTGVRISTEPLPAESSPGDRPGNAVESPLLATLRAEGPSPGSLQPTTVTALPYPGVPTDVQAQLMALLCLADGNSVLTDRVFPDRFLHAAELSRMGANIHREATGAVINGVARLSGANVMAGDLRASAALVLAALAAEGSSTIRRIYHLDRGYQRLDDKLNQLGARIQRISDEPGSSTQPPHWLAREQQASISRHRN